MASFDADLYSDGGSGGEANVIGVTIDVDSPLSDPDV